MPVRSSVNISVNRVRLWPAKTTPTNIGFADDTLAVVMQVMELRSRAITNLTPGVVKQTKVSQMTSYGTNELQS
jgi:hypothetical protein